MSAELSRMRWLCRRGMKELDVVLSSFLDERYPSAEPAQQQAFRDLLDMQDPTVYALLLGRETSERADIMALIKELTRLKE